MITRNGEKAWRELQQNIEIYRAVAETQRRQTKLVATVSEAKVSNFDKRRITATVEYALTLPTFLYTEIIYDLFIKMIDCKFYDTSSVTGKFTSVFSQSQHDQLSTISLLEHSCGVYFHMNVLCDEEEAPPHYKDILLFLALTHDFGKNDTIKKNYEIVERDEDDRIIETPHEKISAMFARRYLIEYNKRQISERFRISQNDIDLIYETLYIHHSDKSPRGKNLVLDYLKEADFRARAQELETIKEGTLNIV